MTLTKGFIQFFQSSATAVWHWQNYKYIIIVLYDRRFKNNNNIFFITGLADTYLLVCGLYGLCLKWLSSWRLYSIYRFVVAFGTGTYTYLPRYYSHTRGSNPRGFPLRTRPNLWNSRPKRIRPFSDSIV